MTSQMLLKLPSEILSLEAKIELLSCSMTFGSALVTLVLAFSTSSSMEGQDLTLLPKGGKSQSPSPSVDCCRRVF